MRHLKIILAALLLTLALAAWAWAADVVQGACVSYDAEKHVLVVEEYDLNMTEAFPYGQPTGIETTLDTATALVGITPEPGDVLRVAYDIAGEDKVALKVMNVSKQDLRKK